MRVTRVTYTMTQGPLLRQCRPLQSLILFCSPDLSYSLQAGFVSSQVPSFFLAPNAWGSSPPSQRSQQPPPKAGPKPGRRQNPLDGRQVLGLQRGGPAGEGLPLAGCVLLGMCRNRKRVGFFLCPFKNDVNRRHSQKRRKNNNSRDSASRNGNSWFHLFTRQDDDRGHRSQVEAHAKWFGQGLAAL